MYKLFIILSEKTNMNVELLQIRYRELCGFHSPPPRVIIHGLERDIRERLFLGRLERCGYGNNAKGSRKMLAALIQSTWSILALYLLGRIFFPNVSIEHDEAVVSVLGVSAAIYAGCLVNERAGHYSKWNYLASLFNDISKERTLDKSVIHRMGCLGQDILTMEMWNHYSFNPVFQEVLILSLLNQSSYDKTAASLELSKIYQQGITFNEAKALLSKLIFDSSVV